MLKNLLAVLTIGLFAATTNARDPVRIVIPTAPGGSFYLYAKNLEPHLEKWIEKEVLVESKPGANGTVAYNHMQLGKGNGYMFFLSSVLPDAPYDQLRDLKPVLDLGSQTKILFAHASVGQRNLKQILSGASKPQYTYGILNFDAIAPALAAVSPHVKGRTDFVPVVYNRAPDVMSNAVGQHIDFGVLGSKVVQPLAEAGQVVAVAAAGPYRSKIFPNVPTLLEMGYRGSGDQWHNRFILWATDNTPNAVIATVRQNWQAFLKTAEGQTFLSNIDHGLTPEESAQPEQIIRRMLAK